MGTWTYVCISRGRILREECSVLRRQVVYGSAITSTERCPAPRKAALGAHGVALTVLTAYAALFISLSYATGESAGHGLYSVARYLVGIGAGLVTLGE